MLWAAAIALGRFTEGLAEGHPFAVPRLAVVVGGARLPKCLHANFGHGYASSTSAAPRPVAWNDSWALSRTPGVCNARTHDSRQSWPEWPDAHDLVPPWAGRLPVPRAAADKLLTAVAHTSRVDPWAPQGFVVRRSSAHFLHLSCMPRPPVASSTASPPGNPPLACPLRPLFGPAADTDAAPCCQSPLAPLRSRRSGRRHASASSLC